MEYKRRKVLKMYKKHAFFKYITINKTAIIFVCLILVCIGLYGTNNLFLFIYIILCIFVIIVYKNMNEYICINIFTGSIHMRYCNYTSKEKSDIEIMNELSTEFLNGLKKIPKKTRFCPFRAYKKCVVTNTHSLVVRRIEKVYGKDKFTKKLLKKGIVEEKLFKYNLNDIKNISDAKIELILKPTFKYKVKIEIKDI